MKEHCSVTRLLSGAAFVLALAAAPLCSAQTQIADASQPNVTPSTATYTADPSTAALASRIDDLEKQLVVMRGQLAMQKAEPTTMTADATPLADQAAAAPAAPAAPTIAG